MLVVGLGIGAAVAHLPVASADTSNDWLLSIDTLLSGGGVSAAAAPDLDLAISFNGTSLISDGSAVADSGTAGDYGLAIAFGSDTHAIAAGFFDLAFASGTGSGASAGDGSFNAAVSSGTDDLAGAGGVLSRASNGDFASAFGTDATAGAGDFNDSVSSGHDVAMAFDPTGGMGSAANAGDGNYDFASVVGDASTAHAGFVGDFDLASAFGDMLTATATGGSGLVDILPSL